MNRHSSDKLLSQIYRRQESESLSTGKEKFISIHDELAQLRTQINHLQRTVDLLPERICALLKQQNQQSSSSEHNNSFKQQQTQTFTKINDEEEEFDKLSSSDTSILSDIEILNESIEDNNRELIAWCRRLQLNDVTNNMIVESSHDVSQESPCQSKIFDHWERRYSGVSQKIPENNVLNPGVSKLFSNYTANIDKNVWLK